MRCPINDSDPMNNQQTVPRHFRWSLAGALLAILMASVLAGCKKPAAPPPPPPIVQVMELTETNVPLDVELIGQLDSPQNVEIRARVEGFVDKMFFVEGTNVNQGDPLFELDKNPYRERLDAAKGSLGEMVAALKKYEADVARLAPLATNRAIPKQDLDNALASVDVGNAAVTSAVARVRSAELDLGYCDVRAPIAGLIGAKQVSIGELVGKGTPTLMATISTLDPIWIYCNVSEVGFLKANAEASRTGRKVADATVTLIKADGTVHPGTGKIVFIDRAVDVKTGTLRVRAQFPNPQQLLRPGMFGRIKVDLGTRPKSILVPERAVVELQGKNFVWVIDSDKKAAQKAVTVLQQIGENLVIQDGLKSGDHIVVEGLQKVREGGLVQPRTAAEMAEAAAQAAKAAEAGHATGKSSKD
jgi:RND family efflux transporter MFP subunit